MPLFALTANMDAFSAFTGPRNEPRRVYSLLRLTLMLKEVFILLMSLRTLMSTQWTPGVVKVWFSRRVFSYSMVSVQPAVSSGTQLGRIRQHTHMGGLKTHAQMFYLHRPDITTFETRSSSLQLIKWVEMVSRTHGAYLPSTWKDKLESCDTS